MTYGFNDLKTVSIDGQVIMRIPRRWEVWPQGDGDKPKYWGCYEEEVEGEDTDTGTLWVTVDRFIAPIGSKLPDHFNFEDFVKGMVAKGDGDDVEPVKNELTPVERGFLWLRISDVEENGELLRFFFYRYFLLSDPHQAIVGLNLVLTHAQMDTPEFVELREIIDREVRNAFLDPLIRQEEETAEAALGPLGLFNFNDRVKIPLPEAISISYDDTCEPPVARWYGRLTTEKSYAGMFFSIEPMEMRDEDGDPAEFPPGMFVELMGEVLDKFDGSDRHTRMPQGGITYDQYEDREDVGKVNEDGDVFRGYQNHYWRYVRYCDGGAQVFIVLLMLPLPERDDRPYVDLVEYLNRAIRRAEFPELEEGKGASNE